jgi:hypothetical protein
MTDVFEIAMERRARLMAELAEVDDFVRKAESWWKMMEMAQKQSAAPHVLPRYAQANRPEALAA